MKNTFVLFVIVSGVLLTSGHAATKAGYQPATVVSVESRAIPSSYVGDNPSDAPFQPEVFSYDIGILAAAASQLPRVPRPSSAWAGFFWLNRTQL